MELPGCGLILVHAGAKWALLPIHHTPPAQRFRGEFIKELGSKRSKIDPHRLDSQWSSSRELAYSLDYIFFQPRRMIWELKTAVSVIGFSVCVDAQEQIFGQVAH